MTGWNLRAGTCLCRYVLKRCFGKRWPGEQAEQDNQKVVGTPAELDIYDIAEAVSGVFGDSN